MLRVLQRNKSLVLGFVVSGLWIAWVLKILITVSDVAHITW
jgi:hypothetical protein